MRNQKGLSLVEIMVSAGAFVVFAMLIQNVLLLAHSFQISQKNLLDTFQINQIIKQKVCMANSAWTNRNIHPNSTYIKKINKVSQQTEYKKLSDSLSNPSLYDSHRPKIRLDLRKNASDTTPPQDVYQDSHTLVVLNSNSETLHRSVMSESADFLSGYIFASRCVKVHPDSLIKMETDEKLTFDSSDLNKSATHILGRPFRPYTFPKGLLGEVQRGAVPIKCCQDGSDPQTCVSAIEEYAPRLYVIHLTRSDITLSGSSAPAFAGKIQDIQELPEEQDMDIMWAGGFMLSTLSEKRTFSLLSFNVDIMVLKNTCATSYGHIKNCVPLSLGVNPSQQKLIGIQTGVNMAHFIQADISACSGYSSGVDTSSAIIF